MPKVNLLSLQLNGLIMFITVKLESHDALRIYNRLIMVIYNGETVCEKLLLIPHNQIFQADRAAGANRENSSGKVSSESSPCIYNLQILVMKKGKIQTEQFSRCTG